MRMDESSDDILTAVVDAATERDWERLKFLLHPYLHWSEDGGAVALRGRTTVLRWLAERPGPLKRAERIELRDGQIYRWFGAAGD
jgi:hypothetical protein